HGLVPNVSEAGFSFSDPTINSRFSRIVGSASTTVGAIKKSLSHQKSSVGQKCKSPKKAQT
ncbi:MAG: hypothetical protein RSE44_29600, partial [Pseudomonas sp.]